ACHRVDTAVRGGRLPCLAEWFGTYDGRTVVGWYEGRPSSSDSSHLTHFHGGVWTEFADDAEQLNLLVDIITGEDDPMPTVRDIWLSRESDVVPRFAPPDDPNPNMTPAYALGWTAMKVNQTYQRLGELE